MQPFAASVYTHKKTQHSYVITSVSRSAALELRIEKKGQESWALEHRNGENRQAVFELNLSQAWCTSCR